MKITQTRASLLHEIEEMAKTASRDTLTAVVVTLLQGAQFEEERIPMLLAMHDAGMDVPDNALREQQKSYVARRKELRSRGANANKARRAGAERATDAAPADGAEYASVDPTRSVDDRHDSFGSQNEFKAS